LKGAIEMTNKNNDNIDRDLKSGTYDSDLFSKEKIDTFIERIMTNEKPKGLSDIAWQNAQAATLLVKIPYLKMDTGTYIDAVFSLDKLKTGNDKIYKSEPDKPKPYWDFTITTYPDNITYVWGCSGGNYAIIREFIINNEGKPKLLRIYKEKLPQVPQPRYRVVDTLVDEEEKKKKAERKKNEGE
jgi:hypothetical protein